MNLVLFLRIQTIHGHTRQMLITKSLSLPPVKNRTSFIFRDKHHTSSPFLLIWIQKSILISKLYNVTNLLVFSNRIFNQCFLIFRHIFRLDFNAQSSTHCHINTILNWNCAKSLMIWCRTNMTSHSYCWKEIACTPLHINTL